MENIIEINGLCKSFGSIKAVDGLSFKVKKGELFAFLGVNGAGKSTTISVMCGQLKKDSGSVFVCGKDADRDFGEISGKIGVVFQTSVLDRPLSVRENLRSRAALYGITGREFEEKLKKVSELLELGDILDRAAGKLSGGQLRKTDIARAIIHSPELLILDEPTTGLDPQTRRLMWDVINRLRTDGDMTVFLTTHYMEETADADYIVILDGGKIAAEGTPLELKNKYTCDYVNLYGVDDVKDLGYPAEKVGEALQIRVPDTAAVTELILKHPELFCDYEVTKGKMDDVFLAVTGKKLDGEDGK